VGIHSTGSEQDTEWGSCEHANELVHEALGINLSSKLLASEDIFSMQLLEFVTYRVVILSLKTKLCGLFLVGWDFRYCGHYWPIVPTPR
jgi:hypothetical protein